MTHKIETLSIEEARKLVLLSQQLPVSDLKGNAATKTLASIEHLGYVQVDTLSVVQRAHHHVLWSRYGKYNPAILDQLVENKQVFEYWSHAAAYLPMSDFRYSLIRKEAIATGTQKHWYDKDEPLMHEVLTRITQEGPLMAKDFVHEGVVDAWGGKASKRALEDLYMQGDLMIAGRKNFHKVYDLTERVLPSHVDTSTPSLDEYARFLIIRYLTANGIGQASEMTYLLKKIKPVVERTLCDMIEEGEVVQLFVAGTLYYALTGRLELLGKRLRRNKAKILSPFDNVLIQRKRMKDLFDFDYQIECYVPEAKRQYGYFSLPVLWQGRFVARIECKAERKTGVLHVLRLDLEPSLKRIDAFIHALQEELQDFMIFNGCQSIDTSLVPHLKNHVR